MVSKNAFHNAQTLRYCATLWQVDYNYYYYYYYKCAFTSHANLYGILTFWF